VTVERIGVRLGLIEHAAAIYAGRVAITPARYRTLVVNGLHTA